MALPPGTRLGAYEVTGPLGAGGMGEVYRARDARLDRTVAIKVLSAELAADASARARFEREARAVAALDHPHICGIFDFGDANDTLFLVMPLLDGQTLAARLEKGPLPVEQALTFATQIADALDKAHRQGIAARILPERAPRTKGHAPRSARSHVEVESTQAVRPVGVEEQRPAVGGERWKRFVRRAIDRRDPR